jgi:hypothetical protein
LKISYECIRDRCSISSSAYLNEQPGRVSNDGSSRSNVAEHHRPHADQGAIIDLKPLPNHRTGTNVATAANSHETADNRRRSNQRAVTEHRVVPNHASWAE